MSADDMTLLDISTLDGNDDLICAFIGVTGCSLEFGVDGFHVLTRSSDFSRADLDLGGGVGIVAAVHTSVTGHSSVLILVVPDTLRVGDENRSNPDLGESTD
jgi:hypothetical protein